MVISYGIKQRYVHGTLLVNVSIAVINGIKVTFMPIFCFSATVYTV